MITTYKNMEPQLQIEDLFNVILQDKTLNW